MPPGPRRPRLPPSSSDQPGHVPGARAGRWGAMQALRRALFFCVCPSTLLVILDTCAVSWIVVVPLRLSCALLDLALLFSCWPCICFLSESVGAGRMVSVLLLPWKRWLAHVCFVPAPVAFVFGRLLPSRICPAFVKALPIFFVFLHPLALLAAQRFAADGRVRGAACVCHSNYCSLWALDLCWLF